MQIKTQNTTKVPNALIRGALFSINKLSKERLIVRKKQIFSASNYSMLYTGEELDQNDCLTFQALCLLSSKDGGAGFSLNDVMELTNRTDGGSYYDVLWKRIERLKMAQIHIKSASYEYIGNLIHEVYRNDKNIVININEKFLPFFSEDATYINVHIKSKLKSSLSKWLHDFYQSHSNPIGYPLESLVKMTGYLGGMSEFKRKLKISMDELVENGCSGIIRYEIENSKLFVDKKKHEKKEILIEI